MPHTGPGLSTALIQLQPNTTTRTGIFLPARDTIIIPPNEGDIDGISFSQIVPSFLLHPISCRPLLIGSWFNCHDFPTFVTSSCQQDRPVHEELAVLLSNTPPPPTRHQSTVSMRGITTIHLHTFISLGRADSVLFMPFKLLGKLRRGTMMLSCLLPFAKSKRCGLCIQ